MAEAAPPPLPPAANGAPRVTVPPPAQGPRVVNLAALAREYVMGSQYQAAADYLRSLPQYIDDVSRDLRADLYDEMLRTDPVISSGARMVKQSVLSDGITLRPAVDDEDDPLHDDAKAVCDFCVHVAGNLRTPAEEVSEDLLSGMFLGNKLAEQVYAEMDPGTAGLPPTKSGKPARLWTLDRVKPKPRESVRPVVDAYGNFVAVQARIPGQGLLSVAGAGQQISDPKSVPNLLPRSKFAAFIWEPKDADPRGTSILRPCYVNWWQKLQALGSWLQWLALCATPMLVGVLSDKADAQVPVDALNNPTGAAPVDPLQQLLNILIQARSGNSLALPSGTKVEWLTAPGKGDQFATAVKYHDDCMTRAITLQTLATQDSEHNTRAASQVHQDTLGVGVRKARGVLGRVWTWDVWYWLTYWNFGKEKADALCPRAVLAPVEQHDRQSQLPAYASVGYQLAPSQMQAVDEELGLPQRTPEEARPPEPPQGPPSGQEPPGKDAGPLDATFAFEEGQHPRGQPQNRGQFAPGGGGAGGEAGGARPQRGYHEEAARVADSAHQNMRALLAKMKKGEYHPQDVLDDVEHYAGQAEAASRSLFASRYNGWREHARTTHGPDALRSPEWRAVRDAFHEAQDRAAESIDGMADVVRAEAKYAAAHPDAPVKIDRASVDVLADRHDELVQSYDDAVGKIADAVEAFQKAQAGKGKSPGQEAGFAWDELQHPRDRIGRFAEAAGAEVAAHVTADAGARTSELHRSTGAVLKKALADLKPKVRAEVDALLPRAVARLMEVTGLPEKTFRPLLKGAGALADAVMDHYRGQGRELQSDIRNRLARWQPEDAAHALAGKFGAPSLTKEDVADALDDQIGRIVERYKEEHDPPEGLPPAEEEAAVARVTREAEQLESAVRAVLWATFNPPRAAGFAFDPDEPRDDAGKWTAGGGAAPAWKAEVYRPPGGRYLGRKAETPAGTAQSAALDLGDHARYVWNALADTRDPAERRTQTAAALEEFRHEAHATLHDLARRLGDTPTFHAAADREAARLHDHLGKVAGRALDALDAAGKDRQKVKEARKELRRQLSAVIDRPHAAGGRGRDALAFEAAGRVLRASGQEAGFAGEGDGHWVTIEGEHVFIKGGVIAKGPPALVGKDPAHLPPRSETQSSHAAPRKVKDTLHEFVSHVNTLGADIHNLWPNQQKAEAALEGLSHAELRELAKSLGHDDPGPTREDALRAARMAVGSAFAEASGHESPRPASLHADLSKVDDALHHGTPAPAVSPEEGARALAAVKSRAEAGLSASPAGFLAKRTYRKATEEALSRMSPAAHARLEQGLRAVHYGADRQSTGLAAFEAGMKEEARVAESEGRHADAAASRSALDAVRKDPASLGSVGGCYVRGGVKAAFVDGLESNPTGGTSRGGADYVVRGKDHAGVYAHEFTHAVDHAGEHSLSDAVAWRDAFHGELAGGRLTEYAGTSPSEAFAEFGRVLYTGGRDLGKVERDFPRASAYFKEQGLWPTK